MSKHHRTKAKSRARRKPSAPPLPTDGWTAAKMAGVVIEPVMRRYDDGSIKADPNGQKIARRINALEHYQRRGILGKAEINFASALLDAFEATQTGKASSEPVDGGADPGLAIAAMADAQTRLRRLRCLVAPVAWPLVEHVVLLNRLVPTYSHARKDGRPGTKPFAGRNGAKIGERFLVLAMQRAAKRYDRGGY